MKLWYLALVTALSGDTTPGGSNNVLLLEDGFSALLLEDNSYIILQ